eukprot:3905615-Karenia_brevis.AAC.1
MPEDAIDNMRECAKTAPARKKAWQAAKNATAERYSAEHTAKVKAATSSWQSASMFSGFLINPPRKTCERALCPPPNFSCTAG